MAGSMLSPALEWIHRRIPAIPIAMSFAVGIALDASLEVSGWIWSVTIVSALLTALSVCACSARQCGGLFLALTVFGCGALRHHAVWSAASRDDVGLMVTDETRPVRLRGAIARRPESIVDQPDVLEAPWRPLERTVLVLECRQLFEDDRWIDATGLVRVDVAALVEDLRVRDEVEVLGRWASPSGPTSEGAFDLADSLRRQEIRGLLRCRSRDAIQRLRHPGDWISQGHRALMAARVHCEHVLKSTLSPDMTPVAIALLLGQRARMNPRQYDTFIESGTMHVLAISGLNVAILAMFVGGLCRWFNLSRTMTAVLILILVGGYTAITEAGPPVVRASLLVFLAAIGWPWHRAPNAANLLAVTGLGVLLWSPTDLFDAGAQLSFLAVAVILWQTSRRGGVQIEQAVTSQPIDPTSQSSLQTEQDLAARLAANLPQSRWMKFRSAVWRTVLESFSLSSWIWLFTAPLIARRFHLVSPIGLLANLPLLPVTTVSLCFGYSLLLIGFVSVTLAVPFAWVFEWSLRLMLWIVNVAARVPLGHAYVPDWPTWWHVGISVIGVALLVRPQIPLRRSWAWRLLLVWGLIGSSIPFWPAKASPLRCTFLPMGHGLSVLIEFPNGRTLLYDAGMMGTARRGTQIVQQALWHRGRHRLDGLLLSHADTDHMNGVPGLLRTIPVGTVLVSPQFVDRKQPVVREVLRAVQEHNVPVKFVWQDDALSLDRDVTLRVQHPDAMTILIPDNANSVVLRIEYAGRRILLTGDLEGTGLQTLLQQSPTDCDVLLAPHHGSLTANTRDLARWATPEFVIVSNNGRANLTTLRERYAPSAAILGTARFGAITFEIDAHGELSWSSFVQPQNTEPRD